jgi:hypothetical protein
MSGRKRRTDGAGESSSVPKQPAPETLDLFDIAKDAFFDATKNATTAVFFSIQRKPDTYLLDFTRPTTINRSWNWGLQNNILLSSQTNM